MLQLAGNIIEALSTVSGIDVIGLSHPTSRPWNNAGNSSNRWALWQRIMPSCIPATGELSPAEASEILERAFKGNAPADDASRFTAHMLMEMARMSIEDGLVMQLHPGSLRNHNACYLQSFWSRQGC